MSDTSNFGFGTFVPGFDFLQSLVKGASGTMPQLPKWVAPTLSVEEIEKRVAELKAVQFWLEQNSRALTATIQALEVQKMTLATLQGMNLNMADLANAFTPKASEPASGSTAPKAAPTPAASAAPAPAEPATAARDDAPEASADKPASVVDPLQWWSALTSQFQQIASTALKDVAAQASIDTTQNMATEALKTATDMASQLAAKGVQTMQDATRTMANATAVAAAQQAGAPKTPARKTAAQTAGKTAAKTPRPRKTAAKSTANPSAQPAAKSAAKSAATGAAAKRTARKPAA